MSPSQDFSQIPHPFAVEVPHHGTPLFAIEVHSKYSLPLYVKGKVHASPSVVKVKHPEIFLSDTDEIKWKKFLSPVVVQDFSQFPQPMAVVHQGTPLLAIDVHSLYSVPLYVKGKVHASPAVVNVKHPEVIPSDSNKLKLKKIIVTGCYR